MKRVETKYLQFFQHIAVCMRELCSKSSNYCQMIAELTITLRYELPTTQRLNHYLPEDSTLESHLIEIGASKLIESP